MSCPNDEGTIHKGYFIIESQQKIIMKFFGTMELLELRSKTLQRNSKNIVNQLLIFLSENQLF